jgi:hypothetical protein
MRARSWLRAALPPALALAVLTLPGSDRPLAAQRASSERALYVSALDSKDLPVAGLGDDAFIVKENGVRREVLRVSRADDPIDLTVLIDNSTAAGSAISFYRKALPAFLGRLAPANRIALVGLANRPTILERSTTDAKRLMSRAGALFAIPDSGATLLDAVVEVSEGLMKRDSPRAAIVAIVTDGQEFTNRYAKDVIATARKTQVAIHLVTIGRFYEQEEQQARERVFFINQAPAATGGSHASMAVASGLETHLDRLARELTSQYKVVYARPDSLIPPDTIEVMSAREGVTMRGTPERTRKGA